jgi:hypothetical protein
MPFTLKFVFVAGLLFVSSSVLAQKTSEALQITFHVTAVRQEPDTCGYKDCQATAFTVEGYAESATSRTEYVLTCTELMALKPSPHVAIACGSIHADHDYQGKVFDNSISFWPAEKYTPPPHRGLWAIQSEKTASR